jgi:putative transposase
MKRLCPFENLSFHHIYSKSIYRFEIFSCKDEYQRMLQLIQFYKYERHSQPFSQFILKKGNDKLLSSLAINSEQKTLLVNILAYCLMPTHIHLVIQQISDKGIEIFMGRLLNAYSRYFNLRHNRRGPLWESRFGNRIILDQRGLNQRIMYVHYNPVKASFVKTPEKWPYSSAFSNTLNSSTPEVEEVITN